MTEDFLPPARHRLGGRGDEAEQDVSDRVEAGRRTRTASGLQVLSSPRGVERARPVVEQRRVVDSSRHRHRGVGLVPGRRDRVVAAALGLQPAGCEVEMAALRLCVEQGEEHGGIDVVGAGQRQVADRAQHLGAADE